MEGTTMGSKGTDDLTTQINAIWTRYQERIEWADAAEGRGDTFRAGLARDHAWGEVVHAFSRLARKPELYIICGEHPVFVDPTPPANDLDHYRCVTCKDTGRLVDGDGRPCQFCCRPTERPAVANDVEEPTAIEGATVAELPVIDADVAALEADINRRWALHDGRYLDAIDHAQARIEAELARVAAAKAVR